MQSESRDGERSNQRFFCSGHSVVALVTTELMCERACVAGGRGAGVTTSSDAKKLAFARLRRDPWAVMQFVHHPGALQPITIGEQIIAQQTSIFGCRSVPRSVPLLLHLFRRLERAAIEICRH